MASRMAASLPGHGLIQRSACEAVFDRRGSSTTSLAPPLTLPSMMRCAWGLK